MLKLCLVGGLGRMGKAIASQAADAPDLSIVSVWDSERAIAGSDASWAASYAKNEVRVVARGESAVEGSDVVVDFSLPDAFGEVIRVCLAATKPLVTGTTGIAAKEANLATLARKVAVVSSPNMALGINAAFRMCEVAACSLGAKGDIEIVEVHHRTKKDKPSGTALEMARIIGSVTGKSIPTHSLRLADVPGKHTVFFSLKGETLEITHNAQSRECFAAGALEAARFVARARPGLYTMLDVIGSGKSEVQVP